MTFHCGGFGGEGSDGGEGAAARCTACFRLARCALAKVQGVWTGVWTGARPQYSGVRTQVGMGQGLESQEGAVWADMPKQGLLL